MSGRKEEQPSALSLVLLRLALRLWPVDLRRELGEQWLAFVAAQRSEARYSKPIIGSLKFWRHLLLDMTVAALRSRQPGAGIWRGGIGAVDKPTPARLGRIAQAADALLLDCRFGVRQLGRDPRYTAVSVAVLTVGLSVTIAVFGVISAVAFRPHPIDPAGELYRVDLRWEEAGEGPEAGGERWGQIPYQVYEELTLKATAFEALVYVGQSSVTLSGPAGPLLDGGSVALVSDNFFSALGLRPQVGRGLLPGDARRAPAHVVISDELWARWFERSPGAVGRTISMNHQPYEIVGVAPAGVRGLRKGSAVDAWVVSTSAPALLGIPADVVLARWGANLIGRLAEGRSEEEAVAQVLAIGTAVAPELFDGGASVVLQSEIGVTPSRMPTVTTASRVGSATALLTLLVAGLNITSLQVAKVTARSRELATRVAVGCGPRRLAGHLAIEYSILATLGMVLALPLAGWLARALAGLVTPGILTGRGATGGVATSVDVRVLAFAAVAFAAVVAIATAFGARRASHLLSAGERGAPHAGATLRRIVGAQVAAMVFLLLLGGLFARSYARLYRTDHGLELASVIDTTITPALRDDLGPIESRVLFERVVEELKALPYVTSVALGWRAVYVGFPVELTALDGEVRTTAAHLGDAGEGYFETLGMTILRGRGFSAADIRAGDRAVVTASLADRLWPGGEPIGKRLRVDQLRFSRRHAEVHEKRAFEVVGVVSDVLAADGEQGFSLRRTLGARGDVLPRVFVPVTDTTPGMLFVRVESDPRQALAAVRQTIADVAGVSTWAETLRGRLNETIVWERTYALFFGSAALLVGALAVFGVFGVTSLLVAGKVPEIGVRLALGAKLRQVAGLILSRALLPVAIGTVIGVAAALAAGRFVASLLFGQQPSDPLTIAGVVGLTLLAALAAIIGPTLRATRVDPILILRED